MPLHRPKVHQMLNCEWVANNLKPKKSSDSGFEEAKTMIKHRKKAFWCTSAKSRTPTPSPSKSANSNTDLKKAEKPIECYTKKYNNVPVENFTNPINRLASSNINSKTSTISNHTTIIPISNNINKRLLRNHSLINSSKIVFKGSSSKKKIGPIDILNSHEIIQVRDFFITVFYGLTTQYPHKVLFQS